MDDSCARNEWGWNPKWGLEEMVDDMLAACRKKVENGEY
jgi:nucleoside-diphosphate-sugar epimerase